MFRKFGGHGPLDPCWPQPRCSCISGNRINHLHRLPRWGDVYPVAEASWYFDRNRRPAPGTPVHGCGVESSGDGK